MNDSKIINDPVFGFIKIPRGQLLQIVQHPLMQRLTRIKQLGLASVVYPAAQHTRFQHSIGAFHLMSEAITSLQQKGIYIFDKEEEAVEAARENAHRNQISNCEFIAGDVLKVLDEIEEKPDLIILDPPRDGVHPKALPKILSYGVNEILYISCKPTSLARDLPAFLEAGYQPVRGVCVDQFPWTANVETIVLLSNRNLREKEHLKVEIDMDEYRKVKENS